MDDLLQFSGDAHKLIIESATIKRGTFSDKEGKKKVILEAEFNEDGDLLTKKTPETVETYLYNDNEMICLQVADHEKRLLYKIDHYYESGKTVKKVRTNNLGVIDDEIFFYYDTDGLLLKKESKSMTYEYTYQGELLIEERWHSDYRLNQIIRYKYENDKLVETAHFSGEDIPGRRIEYKRDRNGEISEEIIYSASNLVVSHIKYEYKTSYKNNWLKRVKYILHTQNRRKEASEVQYRDIKFFKEPEIELEKPEYDEPVADIMSQETESNNNYGELEFDNGIYKGEIVDGQMHGEGDFIFNTGTRYQGFFKNNIMEGRGKLTYISGKVYEGTFANNVLEGPGACKWENGDFYAGEFKNGKMNGKGCYIWSNGNRFEGIFENNKRTEQGILYKREELDSTAPPQWVNDLFK